MKKIVAMSLAVLILLFPAAAMAKTDFCPNKVCHPYDPNDPCYLAPACVVCGGCSACCGHENPPVCEIDIFYFCETPAKESPAVPALPKTGATVPYIVFALSALGATLLPKRKK